MLVGLLYIVLITLRHSSLVPNFFITYMKKILNFHQIIFGNYLDNPVVSVLHCADITLIDLFVLSGLYVFENGFLASVLRVYDTERVNV